VKAERLLIAIGAAFAAAALGYALVRVVEVALFPAPNPAIVIWSDRSGFVWRAAIAIYIGGMGAFIGYALAARSIAKGAIWLSRSVLAAAVVLALQAGLLP
jgi:hypothetical protein